MLVRVSRSILDTAAMSHKLIRTFDDVVNPEVSKTIKWKEDPYFELGTRETIL